MLRADGDTITLPSGVRARIIEVDGKYHIQWGASGFFDDSHRLRRRITNLRRELLDLEALLKWVEEKK